MWRRSLVAPSHRSCSSRQIEHLNICRHSVDLCRPLSPGTQANYTERVGGTRDEIERSIIRSWKEHDDFVCLDTFPGDEVGGFCTIYSLRHESDAMSRRRRIPTSRQGRIVQRTERMSIKQRDHILVDSIVCCKDIKRYQNRCGEACADAAWSTQSWIPKNSRVYASRMRPCRQSRDEAL